HLRGIKVIIAGAGGAAHLPGMTAAYSPLPVIGVPVQTKALGGQVSYFCAFNLISSPIQYLKVFPK
ncbi:MAG: AIR carboxylase family protein, partial [Bacteroidota bacterium]